MINAIIGVITSILIFVFIPFMIPIHAIRAAYAFVDNACSEYYWGVKK